MGKSRVDAWSGHAMELDTLVSELRDKVMVWKVIAFSLAAGLVVSISFSAYVLIG